LKNSNGLPSAKDMISTLVDVLKTSPSELGVRQIEDAVSKVLNLSQEQLSLPHDQSRSEFQYRLAWSRSYAKKQGLVISPRKKFWAISNPNRP
jgi:restriction system protein